MAAWARSGLSASAFAAHEGVSEASLYRWVRLHGVAAPPPRGLALVEVTAAPDEGVPAAAATWAWEIETPRGTLRSRDALDAERIRAAMGVLIGSRGPG